MRRALKERTEGWELKDKSERKRRREGSARRSDRKGQLRKAGRRAARSKETAAAVGARALFLFWGIHAAASSTVVLDGCGMWVWGRNRVGGREEGMGFNHL